MNPIRLKALIKEAVREVIDERSSIGKVSDEEQMLSTAEAAKFLNIAASTLYDKRVAKGVPYYKTGRKHVYKKSDLIAWREARKVKPVTKEEIQTEMKTHVMNYSLRKRFNRDI